MQHTHNNEIGEQTQFTAHILQQQQILQQEHKTVQKQYKLLQQQKNKSVRDRAMVSLYAQTIIKMQN